MKFLIVFLAICTVQILGGQGGTSVTSEEKNEKITLHAYAINIPGAIKTVITFDIKPSDSKKIAVATGLRLKNAKCEYKITKLDQPDENTYEQVTFEFVNLKGSKGIEGIVEILGSYIKKDFQTPNLLTSFLKKREKLSNLSFYTFHNIKYDEATDVILESLDINITGASKAEITLDIKPHDNSGNSNAVVTSLKFFSANSFACQIMKDKSDPPQQVNFAIVNSDGYTNIVGKVIILGKYEKLTN